MLGPVGRALRAYPELALVLAAAAVGLAAHRPLSWVDHHGGVDTLLVVLVAATGVTIDARTLRAVPSAWTSLVASVGAGITVLPALAWLCSRLVGAGPLRLGVLAVGVAPCEIASVATTAMAGGAVAVAAGALIGSTVATVALAGTILGLEAGSVSVDPGPVAVQLALVVALPLAVGIIARARTPLPEVITERAPAAATAAVVGLVALVASQVHLSSRYGPLVGALVLFIAGSAIIGRLLAALAPAEVVVATVLTTSMRDFAIAAGLASTAFGAGSSGPLGVYGILVLVWGTALAGFRRRAGAAGEMAPGDPGPVA